MNDLCRHLAKTKVIDLTGPEQRVLSGYHAISGQQRPTDDWENEAKRRDFEETPVVKQSSFDMPELLHNIEMLKDSCEQVSNAVTTCHTSPIMKI